ncbi:MAG: response regulator [Bacteroidales bacterium]|nr:response regulator [Bacteroidales bacterium]
MSLGKEVSKQGTVSAETVLRLRDYLLEFISDKEYKVLMQVDISDVSIPKVLYATGSFTDLFGHKREEITNMPEALHDLLLTEKHHSFLDTLNKTFLPGEEKVSPCIARHRDKGVTNLTAFVKFHYYDNKKIISIAFTRQTVINPKYEDYITIARNFPNGAVLIYDHDLKYILAEGKGLKDAGLSAENIVGKKVSEVFAEDMCKKIIPGYEGALKGEKFEYEVDYEGKVYRSFNIPLFADDGSVRAGMVMTQDITRQKNIEKKLHESESNFKALFENGPIGVAYHRMKYDEQRKAVDYYFIDANKAYIELTGTDPRGKYVTEAFPGIEKDSFDWIGMFDRAARGGETVRFQQHFEVNDRWYSIVAYQYLPEHFVSAFIDITEIKKAEEAVVESESILHAAMNNSNAGIILAEASTGKIRYANKMGLLIGEVNEESLDLNGNIKEYISGWRIYHLNGDPFKPDEFPLIMALEKGDTCSEEFFVRYGEEDEHFMLSNASPITDRKGKVTAAVMVFLDITDSKNYEKKIKQINEELYAQNEEYLVLNEELENNIKKMQEINDELKTAKLKAEESDRLKSAFLANMSHEIRTPMNGIIGFSEMFMKPNKNEEQRNYYAEIVIDSSKRLLSIVDDILDLSKIETGLIEISDDEFQLNMLLEELFITFSARTVEKNITLKKEYALPDDDCTVIFDRTKVSQILNNFVSNAFKFTDNGYIKIGYKIEDKELIFFVEDTGIGIPEELHKKIFERFRQAEVEYTRQYGGTGLGLSISEKLAEVLSGKIWLKSKPGKGSTFFFSMPYRPVSKKEIEVEEKISSIYTGRFAGYCVLIVEDESINLEYLIEILRDTGIDIHSALNGEEALNMLNNLDNIDLILMDIRLPVMDGVEAANIIKKKKPDIRIIAQTAYAMIKDKEKILKSGFDDYISKPIDKYELLKKMNLLLKKS